MTDEVKITLVKNTTDETDDDVITAFLELAKQAILHQLYPFVNQDVEEDDEGNIVNKEMPDRYSKNQVEIASYLLNKRGADGELHHSENGVLRIYGSESIPESMLQDIVPQAVVL